MKYHTVRRTFLIALMVCTICFFLPLQIYIISGNAGFGIETALFRYQVSAQGTSLILLTTDLSYVTGGLYSGRTALSVCFWIAGSIALIITTALSLIFAWDMKKKQIRIINYGLIGSAVLFLISCMLQYGPLLKGAAGISMPIGILVILVSVYIFHSLEEWFV